MLRQLCQIAIFLFSTVLFADPNLCQRQLLVQSIESYQKSDNHWARIENGVPPERHLVPDPKVENGHVIYLGAGMEVIRTLSDFPTAKYYHLVDISMPFYENIKGEISRRLMHLPGQVQIDVVNHGYTQLLSANMVKAVKDEWFIKHAQLNELVQTTSEKYMSTNPFVLRVRWKSPALASEREFFVLLHPTQYMDPWGTRVAYKEIPSEVIEEGTLANLLGTIPVNEPLVGIICLGAPAPTPPESELLLNRLAVGGSLVTAKYIHPGNPSPDWVEQIHQNSPFRQIRDGERNQTQYKKTVKTRLCAIESCQKDNITEQLFVTTKIRE